MTTNRDALHPCLSTLFSDPFSITAEQFDEALAAVAATGASGVSLWSLHHLLLGGDSASIRANISAHGLSVTCIEAIYGWGNAASADAAVADSEPSIELCVDYGAPILVAVVLEPELATIDATVGNLAAVADRAAEANVSIAIEFLPWSGIPDLATCWDVVQRADRSNVGILVDSWHWHHQPGGPNPEVLAQIPGDAITLFQICDAEADPTSDMMAAALARRPLPGAGVIHHEPLFEVFREIGADPIVSPEVFSDSLRAQHTMADLAALIASASTAALSAW